VSLFDGTPIEVSIDNKKKTKMIVLSASRMTDMPKYYPNELIEAVQSRLEKGIDIHTLILWTKHPQALLEQPLHQFLLSLKQLNVQLYLQCTITGLGKIVIGKKSDGGQLILEPNAPTKEQALEALPNVIRLLGDARRIRLRIDPIVRVEDSFGTKFSNLKFLSEIINDARKYGITSFTFSFLESGAHRKVDKKFRELGINILSPTNEERAKTATWLKKIEKKNDVEISACCVPGFDITRCIDGHLLEKLHDKQHCISKYEPKKRQMCGCTDSIDIGGWPPKKCYTGCQYCYANSSY
jgi:hypothetical protein